MNNQPNSIHENKFPETKTLIVVSNRTERSLFLSTLIPMMREVDNSGLIKTGGLNSGNLLIQVHDTLHSKVPEVLKAIEDARAKWHELLGEKPKEKNHISDIKLFSELYQANADARYQNCLTRTYTLNNRDMIIEYVPTLNDASIRKVWGDTLNQAEKKIYAEHRDIGKLSEDAKESLSLKILEHKYNTCPISFLIVQQPLMWYSEESSGDITLHAHWSIPKEDLKKFFEEKYIN